MSKDHTSEGTILLPFGLMFEAGVTLKVDDKDIGQGLRFSTCMAQGCLLPVSFSATGMNVIRNARIFMVGAVNASNSRPVAFNVSLNGPTLALDRAVYLVS